MKIDVVIPVYKPDGQFLELIRRIKAQTAAPSKIILMNTEKALWDGWFSGLSEKEKKERGGADGHVLAISEYEPGSEYTYYWGSAWNKGAIKTVDVWNKYVAEYAQKLRAPLTVAY